SFLIPKIYQHIIQCRRFSQYKAFLFFSSLHYLYTKLIYKIRCKKDSFGDTTPLCFFPQTHGSAGHLSYLLWSGSGQLGTRRLLSSIPPPSAVAGSGGGPIGTGLLPITGVLSLP
ncbi:unnamed protein product, partial [Musa hybrid cultivar]